MQRVLIRTFIGLAVVVVLLILAVPITAYAVLHAPPFESMRRAWASALIGSAVGLDAEVTGPIEIGPGLEPSVSLSGIAAERADLASAVKSASADTLRFKVPLLRLLLADVQLRALAVDQLKVTIDIAPKAQRPPGDDEDLDLGIFIHDFVRHSFADDLAINGLTLGYTNRETGFSIDYQFDSVGTRRSASGDVLVQGDGHLNGDPIAIEGKIQPAVGYADTRRFTISAKQASISSTLAGTYRLANPSDEIDATVTGNSPRLAKLLSVYHITSDFDGKGQISAHVSGPLSRPSIDKLDLGMQFETGDKVALTGAVKDLLGGAGIDLNLNGSLARTPPKPSDGQPFYNLGITGFSGRIAGSVDGLLVRDFHIITDSVTTDLHEIGPITAERIWKDPQGRIGLFDILVLAGDPKAPSVRVAGTIKDILQLQGVTLKGDIDFRAADFLDLAAEGNAEKLGHLKGSIAVSDADGSLGLDDLDASVADSSLIALQLKLIFDDFSHQDQIDLATHLQIPNFRAFAFALGSKVDDLGAVKFDGGVRGGGGSLSATGEGLVGQTDISLALKGAFKDGHPVLVGDVGTALLHLSDLLKLASIRKVYLENVDEADADVFDYSKAWDKLYVDLGVKVAKIAGSGNTTSNINGRVTYASGVLGLNPLAMNFLGGNVTASGTIKTGTQESFALRGKVTNLRIGPVLREMEADFPISGTLFADYNLTGEGTNKDLILKTLGGNATIGMQPGWIGNSMLELTALSLPAWLMTRSEKGSGTDLTCVVAPFAFTRGRGTTRGLVLETRNMQVTGTGFVDFRQDTIDLSFRPRAIQGQLLKVAQPFAVRGRLSKPQLSLTGAPMMGAAVDVVATPLNLVGTLIMPRTSGRAPCRTTAAR